MRCLGNRVQGCLSVCASVCWLIRWCGIKGRRGRNIACRACVNSRVYMSDEVVVLKGDLTGRLCKWWLMGSLESLFSQSNEVHLPGGRIWRTGSEARQLGHLTQPCVWRGDGQDGSVVMIPSVRRGGALKDNRISWTPSHRQNVSLRVIRLALCCHDVWLQSMSQKCRVLLRVEDFGPVIKVYTKSKTTLQLDAGTIKFTALLRRKPWVGGLWRSLSCRRAL